LSFSLKLIGVLNSSNMEGVGWVESLPNQLIALPLTLDSGREHWNTSIMEELDTGRNGRALLLLLDASYHPQQSTAVENTRNNRILEELGHRVDWPGSCLGPTRHIALDTGVLGWNVNE
jgi:hypothetical protein